MDFALPERKKRKIEDAMTVLAKSISEDLQKNDGASNGSSNDRSDLHIVTPGDVITTNDAGFMRGHGTHGEGNKMVASVAGVVERVNKLISVKPLKARYYGEIGDVIVGRILEVSQKRWKVDTNSRLDSMLMLSAINLPGGVQRRKSEADELQMRTFFSEGDVLSAEVQAFFSDGSMAIHTRSLKYGKLFNGTFLGVPPALIKRCKSHFHILPCGVEVILGLNGYIWVSQPKPEKTFDDEEIASEPVLLGMRETIARVCNSIMALRKKFMYIYDTSIIYCYEASLPHIIQDMLRPDIIDQITNETKSRLELLED